MERAARCACVAPVRFGGASETDRPKEWQSMKNTKDAFKGQPGEDRSRHARSVRLAFEVERSPLEAPTACARARLRHQSDAPLRWIKICAGLDDRKAACGRSEQGRERWTAARSRASRLKLRRRRTHRPERRSRLRSASWCACACDTGRTGPRALAVRWPH